MAGKGNNSRRVGKPAEKAPEKAAHKPAISKEPGRLDGQGIEEWRKHAAHRGNVVHCSGGTSWFEAKKPAGE